MTDQIRTSPVPHAFSEPNALLSCCAALGQRVLDAMRRTSQPDEQLGLVTSAVRLCAESEREPLSLAVVGQMRAGKSTLVNALVGEELTQVGVTETTATVNWLRSAAPGRSRTFRAHWRNSAASSAFEDHPLSELERWGGDSELAKRTRYLEIFSDSPFLKHIQIVDTPGTRSAIQSHEEGVRGLLAQRHEAETLYYGGVADCLLYVVNPVARTADESTLAEFGAGTRLPGSSPYNSVAVVHKWESQNVEDPIASADAKAQAMAAQLRPFVADVIPVSGPLMRAASTVEPHAWNELVRLTSFSSSAALNRILVGMDGSFISPSIPGLSLTADERRHLKDSVGLPLPCLKLVLRMAMRHGCTDGQVLRSLVLDASGKERLLTILRRRFFDRSRILRSFSLLARIVRPALGAGVRVADRAFLLERRRELIAAIDGIAPSFDAALPGAHASLRALVEETEREHGLLVEARHVLQAEVRRVSDVYDQFVKDFDTIRLIDETPTLFAAELADEAKQILGANGHSLSDRLAGFDGQRDIELVLSKWLARSEGFAGASRTVALQVVRRLEQALEWTETNEVSEAEKPIGGEDASDRD
jgi:hypothetical protein